MNKVISAILIFSIFLVNGAFAKATYAESATILIPSNFTFNTNLTLGSTKTPDVSYLQRFLNYDARTRLTDLDPCIATPLINTFDYRTQDAIKRFQTLYKNETLAPAGLTISTGNLGYFTRNKINQLLKTPAYAQIIGAPTQTSTNSLQNTNFSSDPAVNKYYNNLVSALSGNTTIFPAKSATTSGSLSTDPAISSYFNYLNNVITATSGQNIIQPNSNTSTTTIRNNTGTTSATAIINSFTNSNDPTVANYFSNINKTLATTTIAQTNTVGINPNLQVKTNDQTINNYYAEAIKAIQASQSIQNQANTNQTGTNTQNNQNQTIVKPIILSYLPTSISNCQTEITIIGRNFHPTDNYLISQAGYLKASSSPYLGTIATSTPQTDLRYITFNIRQLSDYNAIQSLYAGTTQTLSINIQNGITGATSDSIAKITYLFPGIRSTVPVPNIDQSGLPYEIFTSKPENFSSSNGTPSNTRNQNNSQNNSNNSNALVAVGATAAILGALALANNSSGGTTGSVSTGVNLTSATQNFGGKITATYTCNCSGNQLVVVKDARGPIKQVILQPGVSRIYQYYNVRAGVNTLGTYVVGGQCLVYVTVGCSTFGAPIGTITQIGTSLGI